MSEDAGTLTRYELEFILVHHGLFLEAVGAEQGRGKKVEGRKSVVDDEGCEQAVDAQSKQ